MNKKLYVGQRYYDPANHRAATLRIMAIAFGYVMYQIGNDKSVKVVTCDTIVVFRTLYSEYELMPKLNRNRKILG